MRSIEMPVINSENKPLVFWKCKRLVLAQRKCQLLIYRLDWRLDVHG